MKAAEKRKLDELWNELIERNPAKISIIEIAKKIPYLREKFKQFCEAKKLDKDKRFLFDVMREVEGLREWAWTLFRQTNPDDYDLKRVVTQIPPLQESACALLLEKNPRDGALRFVMLHSNTHREAAWQMYLKWAKSEKQRTKHRLMDVFRENEDLRQEAGEELLRLSDLEDDDLWTIFCMIWSLQQEAWKRIRAIDYANRGVLLGIMQKAKTIKMRCEAAQKLLDEHKLDGDELCQIIECAEDADIRQQAASELFRQDPNEDELRLIAKKVPSFKTKALRQLEKPKEQLVKEILELSEE
ncbi:hypothetical protein KJ885_02380 [Patescibacteria group bacterium]|nr:hypothetical protein [Patescibacteria group bacterium]